MESLIAAMKAHLESELADVSPAVVVAKGPLVPHQWPDFERYLVVLRPEKTDREQVLDPTHYQTEYPVTVVLIIKRWDEEKSLYGTGAGELGVIALCKLTQTALDLAQLGPVWGGREGGEAQDYEALDDSGAARELGGQGNRLARFYRVGRVDYRGQGRPQHHAKGA